MFGDRRRTIKRVTCLSAGRVMGHGVADCYVAGAAWRESRSSDVTRGGGQQTTHHKHVVRYLVIVELHIMSGSLLCMLIK